MCVHIILSCVCVHKISTLKQINFFAFWLKQIEARWVAASSFTACLPSTTPVECSERRGCVVLGADVGESESLGPGNDTGERGSDEEDGAGVAA